MFSFVAAAAASAVLLLITLSPIVSSVGTSKSDKKLDPECDMNTPQLIDHAGFKHESHFVTTSDGYILNLFRIPPKSPNSPVIFFQHGLVASSDTWLLNERAGSFPFIAADQGYDVWLGNVRGNGYCINHTTYPVDTQEFWDFSFQEMAEKDLPTMVDFALKTSEQEKLFYVGHSQGSEMGFIEFSQNTDLSKKIHLFVALAPIARITHAEGLLGFLAKFEFLLNPIYELFGNKKFGGPSYLSTILKTIICPVASIIQHLCETFDSLLTGFDISNINQTRYEIYSAHHDQSTSTKDIVHWAQLIKAGKVQKFDYEDEQDNMKHYNQTTPPAYNVSNMAVPTVLVAGGHDWLADPKDVSWLKETIKPHTVKTISIEKYNHNDYITGMDATDLVYNPVIQIMDDIVKKERRKSRVFKFLRELVDIRE